jgi:DNA processing protein
MMPPLSPNTKAILLLTAPLIVGRSSTTSDLLSPGEYKRLARRLCEIQCEPADLLMAKSADGLQAYGSVVDIERLRRLLGRGFQLSQAVERWQTRAIWVVSRSDPEYPQRLKERLRGDAPALLYGCGELGLLNDGGLAVVGSRQVHDDLLDYTMAIGRLAARAGKSVISGGAKGIDQAAMRGALEAGGQVCGVLADSLEKQALVREHRNMLLDGHLTLVSPYDPNAGFNVGTAMQRNKLIYALADASLVVSSDINKGGTWAGAIEQLDKFKFAPVYVRSMGEPSPGLDALRRKGARAWPNPDTAEALEELLIAAVGVPSQGDLSFFSTKATDHTSQVASASSEPHIPSGGAPAAPTAAIADTVTQPTSSPAEKATEPAEAPGEVLFAAVRELILRLLSEHQMKDAEIANALQVSKGQAKDWLDRLVEDRVLEKKRKPAVYMLKEGTLL